jgi:catecholate siderophore receptor
VHNQLRYAQYTRDFRITEPIIAAPLGTPLSTIAVNRNIWSGNSLETMIWDQADLTLHFDTGPVRHSLVAGIEGGRETSKPEFDNSSGVPTVPLLNPDPHLPFVATSTFPRFKADTAGTSLGVYAIDTVKLSEHWEMNLGLRWDYFDADYKATRFSTTTPGLVTGTDNLIRIDRMPSYRAALVYKPETNGSLYLDYGTSFNPSAESLSFIVNARAFGISNAFLAPEKNQTVELGTKWDVLDNNLSLTGALFRLEKLNARVPDPTNPGFNMLEGTQRVDGFSLQAVGHLAEDWQLTAGYTYLDSHVVKSAAGAAPVGSPLANTPKNAFTVFTEYRLATQFEIGGGGQYVSSRLAQNVPPIKSVPGYWTFNAMAKYDLTNKMSLQLNVNNILDKYYYDQLHPFHVVPGEGRVALLTLNFKY